MDFGPILKNISKHITLTPEEANLFVSMLEYKQVKARKLLLQEGEVCKASYFVISGCLRGYTVDKNGIEHVLNFAPADWWIGDIYSIITQKPGMLNIEAIEDTEYLILSKANQEKLYLEIPKFERFFRIIIQNYLVANQQRLIDSMSLTATERYLNFCKVYPSLINRLPQKQIAAYLGVTPEFLSKLKSKLNKAP